MPFPASPSNNDVHKVGNRAFTYDSTLGTWDQVRETDREDNIADTTHSLLTHGAAFPPGHIIRSYSDVITGAVNTTTSTRYIESGLGITLSTTVANSKFYISCYFITQTNGNMGHVGGVIAINRKINGLNDNVVSAPAGDDFYFSQGGATINYNFSTYSGIAMTDSPNQVVGTSLTYRLVFKARGSNPVLKIGHNGADSFLTIFEIMP